MMAPNITPSLGSTEILLRVEHKQDMFLLESYKDRCSWNMACVIFRQVLPVHQVPGPPGEVTRKDILGKAADLSVCLSVCLSKEIPSSAPAAF